MSASDQMKLDLGNHTELSSAAGAVLSSVSVCLILKQEKKGSSPALFSYI